MMHFPEHARYFKTWAQATCPAFLESPHFPFGSRFSPFCGSFWPHIFLVFFNILWATFSYNLIIISPQWHSIQLYFHCCHSLSPLRKSDLLKIHSHWATNNSCLGSRCSVNIVAMKFLPKQPLQKQTIQHDLSSQMLNEKRPLSLQLTLQWTEKLRITFPAFWIRIQFTLSHTIPLISQKGKLKVGQSNHILILTGPRVYIDLNWIGTQSWTTS
jgi:hypothetical protein